MNTFYVDGSYSSKNPTIVGWAFCSEDGRFQKSNFLTGDIVSMNQVGGEMEATMEAIKFAIDNNLWQITIKYDFIGLKNWIDGSWNVKKYFVQKYVKWVKDMTQKYGLKIEWEKISPSQNKADKLARAVTGAKDRHTKKDR